MPILTTHDHLLNRRVRFEQPAQGYRVAIDSVLLAAAVPAKAGDGILDIGCGAGAAVLCLACRVQGLGGLGVEIQADLVDIFRRNLTSNAFAAGIEAVEADITRYMPAIAFDHVLMNPPFHDEDRHDVSPNLLKKIANTERTGDLGLWIAAAARALKADGSLTLIHRSDRQDEILTYLQDDFGETEILSLLPRKGEDPRRVVIRAHKGGMFAPRSCRRLVLHKAQGGYTEQTDDILRECQPLLFQSP